MPASLSERRFSDLRKLKALIHEGRVPIVDLGIPWGQGHVTIPPVGSTPRTVLLEYNNGEAIFRRPTGKRRVVVINVSRREARKIRREVRSLLPEESLS